MPSYTSPFTGTVVQPTDVSYYALSFNTNQTLYWPAVVNPTQVPAARIMDCVASVAGLTITLPDARQGAPGTDILVRNLGLFPFTITDAAGGQSVTVPVGIALYFYLIDNTSLGGTWGNLTFAAGTSFADAAQLQGAGLTTITGRLATTQNIVNISVSPSLNDNSRAVTYNWNSGVGAIPLPNATTLSTGWYIGFRNSGSGSLAINAPAGSTINGLTTISVNPGDSGYVLFDNATDNFVTVGLSSPANVTFTSATYDVDAIPGSTLSLVNYAPIIQTYIAQSGTRTTNLAVTLPATTQLYILTNNTNQSGYDVTFQLFGSAQPPIALPANNVIIALSNGSNLFVLSQSTVSSYYAINGGASAPSFSFLSDTQTGMYLVGSNILGLTANGQEMIRIDNTNTLAPVVTVNAELRADLISGGTF
jgi:hypothetical protein